MAALGVIWADGIWNTAVWDTAIWAQDAAPDVTAPTVSSATIAVNGNSISYVFSEAVEFGAGGISGMTLATNGAAVTLTYSSGTGTNTLVCATSRTISGTETLTRSYVQPGNGIRDAAGNYLASFSGQAVTNNSTVNGAPTDISLSSSTIAVTAANGATLGTLTVTDPDAGDTHTFALAVGTGDTNNADVAVDINTGVVTVDSASTLGAGSYTFRVTATDSATNPRTEAFAFTVISTTRFIVSSPTQSPIGDIVVDPVVS